MDDALIGDALEIVRAAIKSGDLEQLEAAEKTLRNASQSAVRHAVSPVALEACHSALIMLRSATVFYAGLTAVMKIRLNGYGTSATATQLQPGSRFAVEA